MFKGHFLKCRKLIKNIMNLQQNKCLKFHFYRPFLRNAFIPKNKAHECSPKNKGFRISCVAFCFILLPILINFASHKPLNLYA